MNQIAQLYRKRTHGQQRLAGERASGSAAFGYQQELKRSLGLYDLLAYGLVFIAPITPVAVFGIVFNTSHGMVPLVYLIGLVAMVFTALSYMGMSREFPAPRENRWCGVDGGRAGPVRPLTSAPAPGGTRQGC